MTYMKTDINGRDINENHSTQLDLLCLEALIRNRKIICHATNNGNHKKHHSRSFVAILMKLVVFLIMRPLLIL